MACGLARRSAFTRSASHLAVASWIESEEPVVAISAIATKIPRANRLRTECMTAQPNGLKGLKQTQESLSQTSGPSLTHTHNSGLLSPAPAMLGANGHQVPPSPIARVVRRVPI